MTWDPRQDSADCDHCPLRDARFGNPVPPRWPDAPRALLVGEVPGGVEVKRAEPFVGKAGSELQAALAAIGIPRSAVAITNVLPCMPPGEASGALERFLKSLDRERKRAAKGESLLEGEGEILDPRDCCRPRLLREIERCPNVITLGGTALHAIAGGSASVMNARGSPLSVGSIRVLPTLHPSFVMRSRRWRGAFRADLARAFRWFSTGLEWRDPETLFQPGPEALRRFLEWASREPFTAFDVETSPGFPAQDHFDALHDRLRCLGIGTAERGVVIPFRSVDPTRAPFYPPNEQREIVALVREYLTSPRWRKVGWNSRVYDRIVLESRLGVVPTPHLDALGLHRLAEPELPHDLGYAGSIYTDVDDWKAGHTATSAQTDEDLWRYNAKDLAVTAMTVAPLKAACERRNQLRLLPMFARLQDVCADLHRNGLLVDQAARRAWDSKLVALCTLKRRELREITGRRALNPGSLPQLRDLLFEKLQILPHHYTDGGDPSTDDDSLRAFLSSGWGLNPHARRVIGALRDYRRYAKRRGAVIRLRPITEDYYEAPELAEFEETQEEKEERESRVARGRSGRACGLVLPNGRVHPNYLAQGTVGWRLSSNTPNCQNYESKLRNMFVAAPGNVLVACDEAQLELRMVVGLSKCRYYLDKFDREEDPHHDLCVDQFGDLYLQAEPDGKKKLRRCVKELTYSGLYGAGDETKHEIVTSAEDDKTERLLFPDFTLREVRAFSTAWHRRCPEIKEWWESVIKEWQGRGYLAEPIMGLRVDFLDGEDRNAMLNVKPQSGGAALCHLALFRARERMPREAPSAKLVQQGHDSIVFECLEKEAPRVAKILEESMAEDGTKYGLPVKFVGEVKIGKCWKDV